MHTASMTEVALFQYVGSSEIAKNAGHTERQLIETSADVLNFLQENNQNLDEENKVIVTFIVSAFSGVLYIADRHSEHISCARGKQVRAAGEMSFQTENGDVKVSEVTNQSTGFCPIAETSWPAVEQALDKAGIARPAYWTQIFVFRSCRACGQLNIVKDDWFFCAECDESLPEEWNCDEQH